MGVKLFIIPAKPDEIVVSAKVNKNAGKKLPSPPTIEKKNKSILDLIFRKLEIDKGIRTKEASSILRVPTCADEKITRLSSVYIPFFININELPQIQANRINRIQLLADLNIAGKDNANLIPF
jgi:hypothetical protein